MFDDNHVKPLLWLADHAEKNCKESVHLNEIYKIMLQICSQSSNWVIKGKTELYYKKLPLLRHSREILARYVMNDQDFRDQMKRNIIYTTDLTECAIRQLITPDMSAEEKLFYYLKASQLYETVLDEKYAGFYDVPLFSDYSQIASLYMELKNKIKAREYINKIIAGMEKHLSSKKEEHSKLLFTTYLADSVPEQQNCRIILDWMINNPTLDCFKEELSLFAKKYNEYFNQ